MLHQLLSDKLNYGLLLLLIALIFYASIGFAIETPPAAGAALPYQEDAVFVIAERAIPPTRTTVAGP